MRIGTRTRPWRTAMSMHTTNITSIGTTHAIWFNLADEACEDALYDVAAFRDS